MKYYTGVGSRETPQVILDLMFKTAKYLDSKNYILRSGGARGADCAFEMGASIDKCHVYSINAKHKAVSGKPSIIPDLEKFRDLAKLCCLHYNKINSQYAKDLHTRNICQIIGSDCDNIIKSEFVLCYTQYGEYKGGTTTAIRCAERFDVPIFNFGTYDSITDDILRIKEIKYNLKLFLELHTNEVCTVEQCRTVT